MLALTSTQHTSRILRRLMRSRLTKIVLGIFVGILAYRLIGLRSIRSGDGGAFVTETAAFLGFVMIPGGAGALTFFVHHHASSIPTSKIVTSVAPEPIAAIYRLFPTSLEEEPASEDSARLHNPDRPVAARTWRPVIARKSGSIQGLKNDARVGPARDHQSLVPTQPAIGQFVVDQTPHAFLAKDDAPNPHTVADPQATLSIGRHRTVESDATCGIRQIMDVTLKAPPPDVTDTTTAVMCIDDLTDILTRVASRRTLGRRRDEKGELRVITETHDFESLLDESFEQIRGKSGDDAALIFRLPDAFTTLAGSATAPYGRRRLRQQALGIDVPVECTVESRHDRTRIGAALGHARETRESAPAPRARAWVPADARP